MNPEKHSREEIELKISALLLGELPDDEAKLLRYLIAQDAALKQLHDEIASTIVLVREAVKAPADAPAQKVEPLKMTGAKREKLLAHFKTPRKQQDPLFWLKRIKVPSSRTVMVGALVVLLAGVLAAMLLPSLAAAKSKARRVAAANEAKQKALEEQTKDENSSTAGEATDEKQIDRVKAYISLKPSPAKPSTPNAQIVLPQTQKQSENAGEVVWQDNASDNTPAFGFNSASNSKETQLRTLQNGGAEYSQQANSGQATSTASKAETETRRLTLKYANPNDMANTLDSIFQNQNTTSGLDDQQVKIVSDPRTQSVIVTARKDQMNQVNGVVEQMDLASTRDSGVAVMPIHNADPYQVAQTLRNMFGSPSGNNVPQGAVASSEASGTSVLQMRQQQLNSSSSSSTGFGSFGRVSSAPQNLDDGLDNSQSLAANKPMYAPQPFVLSPLPPATMPQSGGGFGGRGGGNVNEPGAGAVDRSSIAAAEQPAKTEVPALGDLPVGGNPFAARFGSLNSAVASSTVGGYVDASQNSKNTWNGNGGDSWDADKTAKSGNGTMTLNGVDTYSGETFVNQGTITTTTGNWITVGELGKALPATPTAPVDGNAEWALAANSVDLTAPQNIGEKYREQNQARKFTGGVFAGPIPTSDFRENDANGNLALDESGANRRSMEQAQRGFAASNVGGLYSTAAGSDQQLTAGLRNEAPATQPQDSNYLRYNNSGTVGTAQISVDPDTRNLVVIADGATKEQIQNTLKNLDLQGGGNFQVNATNRFYSELTRDDVSEFRSLIGSNSVIDTETRLPSSQSEWVGALADAKGAATTATSSLQAIAGTINPQNHDIIFQADIATAEKYKDYAAITFSSNDIAGLRGVMVSGAFASAFGSNSQPQTQQELLTGTADPQAVIKSFFGNLGIKINQQDNHIFYDEKTGSLNLMAPRQDLDSVQKAIQVINQSLVQTNNQDSSDRPLPKTPSPAPIPQPEFLTSENAFSTFSLNVSDVSFKLAAASLAKGQLPDAASIRSEEFINAFDYHDPEPAAGVPVAFVSERARDPFVHNRDLLRFSVKTAALGREAGRPLNIVLLLDDSGSMERPDRVEIIHEALKTLASQLQPQDTLSIVTFARTPRLWVDGARGDQAGTVINQVSGLTPEGGTNLEEAMNLAYATARRHYLANGGNRVVLLTDGAANLGNVNPDTLKQKVESFRKQGIALDCFGVGWEGYNDDLLEQLSSNGDGRYAFLNSTDDARDEFAAKLAGALHVAAEDVKVQVEFNPQRVISWRQIGYAKHQLTKEQFRDNTVAAAPMAAREAGNALYTVEINPDGEGPVATVRARFRTPGTMNVSEHEWQVPFNGTAPALENSSPAMRLAATAGGFSEWLATSPFAQEVTPDGLLKELSGVPQIFGADARPKQLETMLREANSAAGGSSGGSLF